MVSTKFHENRFRIDGEINEKHALHIIATLTITKIAQNCIAKVQYIMF